MDAVQNNDVKCETHEATSDQDYLKGLPIELVGAQLIQAEQDAERVAAYLDGLMDGIRSRCPERASILDWRNIFSIKLLLELAAALRIVDWQEKNLVRETMELPDGNQAARDILLNAARDELQPNLSLRLVKVFAENFAWKWKKHLGADVLLDHLPDEQLAEYLADFLWRHRHLA